MPIKVGELTGKTRNLMMRSGRYKTQFERHCIVYSGDNPENGKHTKKWFDGCVKDLRDISAMEKPRLNQQTGGNNKEQKGKDIY